MTNRGLAPADLATNVGKFRLNTNDTAYTELDPPEIGYGDYAINSDDEIEAWLAQADDGLFRALGFYYQVVADSAALEAKNIADHDLRVQTEKRAELLAKRSQDWFDRADEQDSNDGLTDFFDTIDPPLVKPLYCHPEAAPWPLRGF